MVWNKLPNNDNFELLGKKYQEKTENMNSYKAFLMFTHSSVQMLILCNVNSVMTNIAESYPLLS